MLNPVQRSDIRDVAEGRLERARGLRFAIPLGALLTGALGWALFAEALLGGTFGWPSRIWIGLFSAGIVGGTVLHDIVARRRIGRLRSELEELERLAPGTPDASGGR